MIAHQRAAVFSRTRAPAIRNNPLRICAHLPDLPHASIADIAVHRFAVFLFIIFKFLLKIFVLLRHFLVFRSSKQQMLVDGSPNFRKFRLSVRVLSIAHSCTPRIRMEISLLQTRSSGSSRIASHRHNAARPCPSLQSSRPTPGTSRKRM